MYHLGCLHAILTRTGYTHTVLSSWVWSRSATSGNIRPYVPSAATLYNGMVMACMGMLEPLCHPLQRVTGVVIIA